MKRLALPLLLILSLILCLTACAPTPKPGPEPTPTPQPYDATLFDGSVLFYRGGVLIHPISKHTGSEITHAAIILYDGNEPWVYEATPPCVQKTPLAKYLAEQEAKQKQHFFAKRDFSWEIWQPDKRFDGGQLLAMKIFADSQLGRPYMLRGWWKGHEVAGIFCSQLVGDIIEVSGLIKSAHWHESPGSLHEKLKPYYTQKK